ncbi:bifunctional 4-hydroxy-2-oxoglutarate aldolase/2-dehydro-3-deoxy-phosphogluconate aldolase [Deinococcus peraridilitoris]|uniref:Entner-Doudoroff aldolase n=1 Tax=Deinococcus peraridilitoris (strain DSM 19664 / LMG 22246 / CIP 109416 / KR-200) TaxID=937777 RepID=L0A8H1_DEIPD|nr:bifunctional 4-hydroxy-2-oxoglutarate aldolase/2-dehydro-3-deoxy-phosphogluconate aldolase [Deinococcus peraridilitoris]AFZ69472.1 Entner-Doudoroff aldolase [Deinococcus peraridilitoris DSM 19664]
MIETLRKARVVGILRADDAQSARLAAHAAVRGGLTSIELTFTTPGAAEAIRSLRTELPAGISIGAGTIMTPQDANDAVEAGAEFLVSPHLDAEVAATARQAQVMYIPGTLTPTEIVSAIRWGAPIVKIFPAGSAGGTQYLRDLLGPLPQLKALVTGGIKPTEVPGYLHAGALAVGLGSNLFPREALRAHDAHAIEHATRAALHESGLAGGTCST